ncbi:SAM-dependent methyltransferase [Lamprobacter modestohalophilus]|uniref:site-specific DNA-methyltransferase (adenine-specific) n=1 Tax=Lamprobacter modestohalophilus TaxID=1064514 RepID=A0A9X0WDJ9_9GAMM|nr:BREX-1 system adenine-specific DNA-methyltransferase PglX [Lamprobacter modestohalophilus]MBK1621484.1 SAM-dependent methyltransferase [Lamprobacter modestohalophilus]
METAKLKKFAQFARRTLLEQVSAKLKLVLAENSAARRESTEAIKKLEEAIKDHGKEQVIERVAYIWFNRFCALRFMDVNRYTRIGVVSPSEGQFQPEILAEAKMGHIDEKMVHDKVRQQIFALLDGKAPSRDPQGEAYRLLVVAACNSWNKAMPFLFQRIDDYTELLMPDDLLSGNSILAYTREAMTPDACEDVEVIGWLYQFYISEKKDEVFDGLKKNKKITPENIPAATQLFTPHWIVRYLVENSLGRLWLLNRPGSKLAERMDYYIKPEQAESDFLKIGSPEEIKICDPACGSGHMLTYAFDLLYAIYEEEGYEPAEIPEKILTNNLYGIEIDERAGELAAFALTMKARGKQRRFFNKGVKPNICVLENVRFDEDELNEYMDFVGRDLFTAPLQTTLRQFEEADNFGSLIRPDVTNVDGILRDLELKDVSGQLFLAITHNKVLQALRQTDYLSPKYHVVIANPPYLGGKGMNGRMGVWLKDFYGDVKSDLFSAFIVRNTELALPKGQLGVMSPFVWMFIGNFEKLRYRILKDYFLLTLVRPEYHSFFESAFVPICAFVMSKRSAARGEASVFFDLHEFYGSDLQPVRLLEAIRDKSCSWRYDLRQTQFLKIPGSPISFRLPAKLIDAFSKMPKTSEFSSGRKGTTTGNNHKYLRLAWEVSRSRIAFQDRSSKYKFYPHAKGGDARRWYGNGEFVIAYDVDSIKQMAAEKGFRHDGKDYFYREGITWSGISSDVTAFRHLPVGQTFNNAAPTAFFDNENLQDFCLLAVNSKVARPLIQTLNPTLNFNPGDFGNIPIPVDLAEPGRDRELISSLIALSTLDWDSYETSWDFTNLPLLNPDYHQPTLKATYQKLRAHWREMTLEMQRLEEENNRIFIEAYGLQDELTPEVPLNEITLTCNPHYRYGNDKSEDELEALLLADTLRELVSYAVGCMFGRYALDKPGLILANQGETIEDYLKQIPEPSFPADDDDVIPMLDGDWFTDDIAERFRKFLRVAFGDEHYEENLRFVEQALNIKGKRNYSIRDYFLGEFYNDHVRRYKKRPIYWLFSSPKGSFNALIYLHRYRPDTVSVVLNDYLREFRGKLSTRLDHLRGVEASADATKGEKTKALKEIENLKKTIAELDAWERDVMYPLATKQISIDLDDGVKVNYPKFDAALKKIPGL